VLYFGGGGDIRGVLSAAAIGAVAAGAVSGKYCGARLLRMQRSSREQRKNRGPDEDVPPPNRQ
jgi:hypothetical protein